MALGVINRRRHNGLQQLSSLAATGRTFLGPVKSSKFIVEESTLESVLTCSVIRLLESLDLTSAVGQLLNETVQAQNSTYGTGTGTLLFLAGAWSNAALECIRQDIPTPVIVAVMSEGLCSCGEEIRSLQVTVRDVWSSVESTKSCPVLQTPSRASMLLGPTVTDRSLLEKGTQAGGSSPRPPATCSLDGPPKTPSRTSHLLLQSGTGDKEVCAKSSFQTAGSTLLPDLSSRKPRLTHSRHFSRETHHHYLTYQPDRPPEPHSGAAARFSGCDDLGQLAAALSHGDQGSMKLAEAAVRCQHWAVAVRPGGGPGPFSFDISRIVTCRLPGAPESRSCVRSGFGTLVSTAGAAAIRRLQGRPLRVVLLDGDLTESYRHLGFSGSGNVKTVWENGRRHQDSTEPWTDRALEVLLHYNVNLVLVRGGVSETLMERCLSSDQLIIGSVAQNVLQAFAEVTGGVVLSYITQVGPECVGSGVCAHLWRTDQTDGVERDGRVAILFTAKGISLVTVALGGPVTAQMQTKEDGFWTCTHRLHRALVDQKVFLGGGAVEFLCLSHLQKLEERSLRNGDQHDLGWRPNASSWQASSMALYRPAVLRSLASGWHKYLAAIMCNTANFPSEFEASTFIDHHLQKATSYRSPLSYILSHYGQLISGVFQSGILGELGELGRIYDNVTPKLEAWRRALDLVLLVLQTDTEIISGFESTRLNSPASTEFLFL
ncbi:Bardet-Biedl syndrome 12 protein [Tachyglossus aculeatus]|uniref:Bardet-Biedl syndrome 12 protein n=1 Tax=Tachyglossus aculeatus TaxID=9261 RepID=UPI0018F572DA|nr:Bardet-Biedl syndrome 12 protein [Tachyglossus aculeatus]